MPSKETSGKDHNNASGERALTSYCAFLRGINVGGNTLIKMDALRQAFESLGFRNVRTVLASGNVIFEASQGDLAMLSRTIALKLKQLLGRDVSVIVRTLDDLRRLQGRQPFKDVGEPGARWFVTFIPDDAKGRDISGLTYKGFRILSVSNGVICSVLSPEPGVGAVDLMGAIEKEYGPKVTTRSWETIVRILKK